jgi:hypothetical protein
MKPDSRYIDAGSEFVSSHLYDAAGVRENRDGKPGIAVQKALYRLQVLPLPESPDETYMAKVTDTFPLLAKRLFNDPEKWWVVAEANPQIRHPLDLEAADILYIPS